MCEVTGLGRVSADLPNGGLKDFVCCSIPEKSEESERK